MQPNRPLGSCLPYGKKRAIGTVLYGGIVPQRKSSRQEQISDTIKLVQKIVNINNLKTSCGSKYFANVTILNRNVPMLIDTGSQINCISACHCPEDILSQLASTSVTVSGYDGSTIPIRGVFLTDIFIDEICVKKTPIFVTEGNNNAVLGTPALDQLIINLVKKTLQKDNIISSINKSEVPINANNYNLQTSPRIISHKQHQLYARQEVVIQPFSEAIIPATAKADFKGHGTFATEPNTSELPPYVQIAKSATNICTSKTDCIIRVCNASPNPFVIKHRTPLVKVCEVTVGQKTSHNAKLTDVLQMVRIGTNDKTERSEIENVISSYIDVFASENEALKQTDAVMFDIDTGDAPPAAQQRYKTPYFLRNELKKIINHNVKTGLMEPCSSPWAAPVLLVRKPNGSYRLVCDYRKLNSVTVSDQYPLPDINELVNELSESRIFSTTDLFSGFHQIRTTDSARSKLAVATEFGQFTWRAMPMGAKNCPAVFQRLMDKCFRSMPTSTLVIYIDDLLLHSKNFDTHLTKMKEMFEILRSNKLQIRASKTVLVDTSIKFCGYIISNGEKCANPDKVKAVADLKSPTSKQGAQQLFGLLNYHRYFIPNFSKKAASITQTYGGAKNFKWTSAAELALKKLKKEISEKVLKLRIPNVNQARFVLETDACSSGYGAALFICSQTNKHKSHNAECLRPVEYMSRQFTTAQCDYYIQEKELYAGKEALRKWSHYLLGRRFDWQTDNACLKWAHRVRSSKPRISKWLAEISEFDAETILKPSSQMKVTDCLSRQFGELNTIQITKCELASLQESDDILHQIRNFVTINRWPHDCTDEIQFYKSQRNNLVFGRKGELLMQNDGYQVIPPKSLIREILVTYHDENGHPGEIKAKEEIQRRYIWATLKNDIKEFIQSCHACQTSKPNLKPRKPPLGESQTPKQPYDVIAFDLTGPLPITNMDHKYILVGIDLFSKKVYTAPLENKESALVSQKIKTFLFANPHLPTQILSDWGLEFAEISRFCALHNIKHAKSPPYHPSTNGCVERANQTLKQRIFANGPTDDWDVQLPEITHAINCSKNSANGYSPFAVETGFAGRNSRDLSEHDDEKLENTIEVQQNVYRNIKTEKQYRVERHANEKFISFNVGDHVLAKNHTAKFPRYRGPYIITGVRGKGTSYDMEEVNGNGKNVRAAVDLKLYKTRPEIEPETHPEIQDPVNLVAEEMEDDYDFNLNFFVPEDPSYNILEQLQESSEPSDESSRSNPDSRDDTIFVTPSDSENDHSSIESDSLENLPDSEPENTIDDVNNQNRTPSPIEKEQTTTGQPSPRPAFPYKVKLYQMGDREMHNLADQIPLNLQGSLTNKREQLEQHFKKNKPDHERTNAGHLVFSCTFDPNQPRKISDLSTLELDLAIQTFNLSKPSFLQKDKKSLIKHVQKQFLKRYPNATQVEGEVAFGRSGEPKNKP